VFNNLATQAVIFRKNFAVDIENNMSEIVQGMIWAGSGLIVFLGLVGLNGLLFIRRLNDAQKALSKANIDMNRANNLLEVRVSERTRDLQLAADISKTSAQILELDKLLPQVVQQTARAFNLYHVVIALVDADRQEIVFKTRANRQGIITSTQRLSIGLDTRPSLIARAIRDKELVLVNDVSKSTSYMPQAELPNTRAELTVPLMVRGQVLGALDLQHDQGNHFTFDHQRLFSTLAEQIAVAIDNARLHESEIKTAEELRKVDKLKSQFLASMSHELRTPLNSILNFTEFVASGIFGEVNQQQVDALKKSIASGEHLLSLINDLLDVSKIESGMMELFIEEVQLGPILDEVANTARALIHEKPITFRQEIAPNLPPIRADKRRLKQILLNLASNAVKFTSKGHITLTADIQGDELLFSVADTGLGIEPESQKLIFEPFRQSQSGLSSGGGTGLGLPICKHLTEAHGGKIWLESTVGQGTTFFIRIPTQRETPIPV
jgi:signal transduction histidine kinase